MIQQASCHIVQTVVIDWFYWPSRLNLQSVFCIGIYCLFIDLPVTFIDRQLYCKKRDVMGEERERERESEIER